MLTEVQRFSARAEITKMDPAQSDPALLSSDQVDAARFLRSFFDAIARRDWPTVAISVHATASFFTDDPTTNGFSMLAWDRVAGAFKEWMERSVIARKYAFVADKLALEVIGQSVIVTMRGGGPRVMVLTFEGGRWQIHHMHLSRLGIPLTASDIEFSFRGVPLPRPRKVPVGRG
jgi:hypothetical protein